MASIALKNSSTRRTIIEFSNLLSSQINSFFLSFMILTCLNSPSQLKCSSVGIFAIVSLWQDSRLNFTWQDYHIGNTVPLLMHHVSRHMWSLGSGHGWCDIWSLDKMVAFGYTNHSSSHLFPVTTIIKQLIKLEKTHFFLFKIWVATVQNVYSNIYCL